MFLFFIYEKIPTRNSDRDYVNYYDNYASNSSITEASTS